MTMLEPTLFTVAYYADQPPPDPPEDTIPVLPGQLDALEELLYTPAPHQCHTTLAPNTYCAECGRYNPEQE